MSKRIEIVKLCSSERVKYPNLKSLTELKKLHLMPKRNVKPRAIVTRRLYEDYYLYDLTLTEPYKVSKKERDKQLQEKNKIAKLSTCHICGTRYNYLEIKHKLLPFKNQTCTICHLAEYRKFNNPIFYDIETTGLDSHNDEILSISIIDINGNTLFSEYCKPENIVSWEDAESINGITKEMVEDKKPFKEHLANIQNIIDSADLIVSYNGINFDNKFLVHSGISFREKAQFDVMLEFAYWVWHEYSEYHHSFLWKKLEDCAAYYNYQFNAHDSLEDTRATLHCFKSMIEM